MKGSVTPVSGITRVTPPTMTNTCSANTAVSPVASSFENESRASIAILKPRCTTSRYVTRQAAAPARPSSSVITA